MLARIVPLVLIAAIVACPLWCRNGRCQGCCAENQVGVSICPAGGAGDCCCPAGSREVTHPNGKGQGPRRDDSGATGCQGVCGGAVLEKPNSFPDLAQVPLLYDHHASPSPVASRLAACRSQGGESRPDCRMTPGRYIRTLHMSFLL